MIGNGMIQFALGRCDHGTTKFTLIDLLTKIAKVLNIAIPQEGRLF